MIEISNQTKFTVDKQLFLGVAKKVLKEENRERENLSVAFINPAQMQELNLKYRKKDKPTDVLAFEKIDDFEGETNEVVICPTVVKENAAAYGLDFKTELMNVFIHGILHTLGYDHELSKKEEKRMFTKQDYYLSNVNVK